MEAIDQKIDNLATDITARAAQLAPMMDLPPDTPVRDVVAKLDEMLGGELLAAFEQELLPHIREARGLEYDPPPEELRRLVLDIFNDV